MKYNLLVEDFGKIKYANIEISPLTLFVGDNNSGKSYLLSLLWGLKSSSSLLFRDLEVLHISEYKKVYSEIENMVRKSRKNEESGFEIEIQKLQDILNIVLEERKELLVKSIFNYEGMSIGKLEVNIPKGQKVLISSGSRLNYFYSIEYGKETLGRLGFLEDAEDEFITGVIMERLLEVILEIPFNSSESVVYLPAARTGFMLAKDVINKVGRRTAYDAIGVVGRWNTQDIQPFTKSIMQFLDIMEDLSTDSIGPYDEIAMWVQQVMAHGDIQYSETNHKEIRYVPMGEKEGIPLRTTSAVVTELAPLIMMLKYKKSIDTIYYEEPEMCLHPQLQQEMGRLLIRLVNKGIPVIATTHSDIIIQHINNMCRLAELKCPKELMEKLQFSKEDAIGIENIAVYQLSDKGSYSEVEKITPTNGEFQVRTFSNALINILEQTSEVQEFETGQED